MNMPTKGTLLAVIRAHRKARESENLSTAQILSRLARMATEEPEEQCCIVKAFSAQWCCEDGSAAIQLLREAGFEYAPGELERIRAHPSFAAFEKLLKQ